jgi:alpha-1,2-glucosyltransferase
MLFVACSGILDFTLDSSKQKGKQEVNQELHQSSNKKGATLRSNLRKRKSDISSDTSDPFNHGQTVPSTEDTSDLVYDIYTVISTSWNLKWRILIKFSPFIFVVVAFGIFILWNGGIVLGMLIQFTYLLLSVFP